MSKLVKKKTIIRMIAIILLFTLSIMCIISSTILLRAEETASTFPDVELPSGSVFILDSTEESEEKTLYVKIDGEKYPV